MRALDKFFGQICVINLRSRPDRRREMHAQLERIGLGLDSANVLLFEADKPSDAGGFPSRGARGCFMSHLAVLRAARDQGVESVLILEDDLNFCADFPARFDAVASHLERHGWGMLHGVYACPGAAAPDCGEPCVRVDPGLAIETSPFVAVHGRWIGLLVDYLEAMLARAPGDPRGGPMHVDGAYCWFRREHPQLPTWLASPPLGYQRSSRTDVHALQWWDRHAGPAWLVALLRRRRNRYRR